ncbi:MAG: response regulator [Desulfuromonadales bacterium]|nr:response regulator [Desulfuromonadales bacterium]
MKNLVMLVDDEANVLSALTRSLIDEPYELITASSGNEALELMKGKNVKVIVSDERMVGMQGSELLAEVKRRSPNTVRILLTGHATLDAAMRAVNVGEIYRFFLKPWDDTQLRYALMSAIEKYDLEAENRRLLATVKSQAMEIKVLEKRYPGISRVQKNATGTFVLSDISEDELARIIEECETELAGGLANKS